MIFDFEMDGYRRTRDATGHAKTEGGCEEDCPRCALEELVQEVERVQALEREPLVPMQTLHGKTLCYRCREQTTPTILFGVRKDHSAATAVCLKCLKQSIELAEGSRES